MLDLINILATETINCGDFNLPKVIVDLLGSAVNLIQIGIPILLVILGMLDLGKAVSSQKEDEIKKAQSMLIKRLIYGILVFLVVAIVGFVLSIIESEASSAISCLEAIFGK